MQSGPLTDQELVPLLGQLLARNGGTQIFLFGPEGAPFWAARTPLEQRELKTLSAALELIEDGIKVNAICPGNFFDGPLWSDPETGLFVQYLRTGKVPGARTLEDVKRAYESKVPMGRGCTTADWEMRRDGEGPAGPKHK